MLTNPDPTITPDYLTYRPIRGVRLPRARLAWFGWTCAIALAFALANGCHKPTGTPASSGTPAGTHRAADEPSKEQSAPYASATAVREPALFGVGAVSSAAPEFAITFSADGRAAYFNRASADRRVLRIVRSHYRDGRWQPAESLPFSDGTYRDVDPHIPPGQPAGRTRLYFSSDRPLAGAPTSSTASDAGFDTFYVEATDSGWREPVRISGPLGGPLNQVFVSMTRDGTAYVGADSEDGSAHLYRVSIDGQPRARVTLDLPASTPAAGQPVRVGNPCIAPDERFLIFASSYHGGHGGADLFITYRGADNRWGPARNLGPTVNSTYADFAPALSPDGRYLFFTSERPGIAPANVSDGRPPGDIYQVELSVLPGWSELVP